MKFTSIILTLLACLAVNGTHDQINANEKSEWTSLFNGKNLDGFDTYLGRPFKIGLNKDPDNMISVHDNMVHIYKDTKAGIKVPFGYFITKKEYSHYHLRFEYKWGKKRFIPRTRSVRDSGVIYHMVGPQKVWPRGVECQIQEGDTGDIFTVNGAQITTTKDPNAKSKYPVYLEKENGGTPIVRGGKGVARVVKSKTVEKEGWNKVECILHGSKSFVHIINGVVNNRGTDIKQLDKDGKTWIPLKKGKILFQAEGAEVFYRNIEIKILPESE